MKTYILIFIVAFFNGVCTSLMEEEIRERKNMIRGGKLICFIIFVLFGSLILLIGFGFAWILDFFRWVNYHTSIKFFWQFYLTKKWSELNEDELSRLKKQYDYFLRKDIESNSTLNFRQKNFYKGLELIRNRYNKPIDWYSKKDNLNGSNNE